MLHLRKNSTEKLNEQSIKLDNRIVLLISRLAELTYFGTIEKYVKFNAEDLLKVSCSCRDKIQVTKDLDEEMGAPGTLHISFHTANMSDMTLNLFFDSVGAAETPNFYIRVVSLLMRKKIVFHGQFEEEFEYEEYNN
jgi:hypothetical protein